MKKNSRTYNYILSIILPVRNEGININLMLRILEAVLDMQHEVLIVYDDKRDDTIPVIKKMSRQYPNIKPVLNTQGRGVINAIKTGVSNAEGKYILLLAVDDVGPTLAIDDMVALMEKGCDFISCTRYQHGGRRLGGSWVEGILSRVGNRTFSLLCGSAFSDATTGFKMFRQNIFETITLESKPIGWAVVFEMAIKAQAAGLRLGEVPIISIDRLYGGKSSFTLTPWLGEYLRWFIYGIRHWNQLRANTHVAVRIPKATSN
jgi:dolichol-phosphate mannosyltransferase